MRRSLPLVLPPVLAGFMIAALALPAAADDPKIRCDKAVTTVELNVCSERAYQAADAKLNAAYRKALAFIKASGGDKPHDPASWEKALRTSQTTWIAFRDADCKGLVPMSWGGGTGTTSAVLGCMTEKTEQRTAELLAIAEER
jgi:uncharacterized protein YecT (DUF1311 family)